MSPIHSAQGAQSAFPSQTTPTSCARWLSRTALVLPIAYVALAIAASGVRDPEIELLLPGPHGRWIVPPGRTVVRMRDGPPSRPFVFRRRLRFRTPPAHCRIEVTAMRRHQLRINHAVLAPLAPKRTTWKQPSVYDVGPFLQTGENRIAIQVWNTAGPPALRVEGPDTEPGALGRVRFGPWMALGPFPVHGPGTLQRPLAPETDGYRLDAHRSYAVGGDRSVRCRPLVHENREGATVLTLHRDTPAVVYAQTTIESPTDVCGVMVLGTTDGARIWLNGQLIWSCPQRRNTWHVVEASQQCLVPLRMGSNRLLVKMVHTSREARVALRLIDPPAEPVVSLGTDSNWDVRCADQAGPWRRVWPATQYKRPLHQWAGPLQRWPYFPVLALVCGMVLLLSVVGLMGGVGFIRNGQDEG